MMKTGKQMKIVIIGPPGAGKGTQAKIISERLGLFHISTGDIFRKAIKDQTPVGVEAKKYIDKGALVPDEITAGIIKDRIAYKDCDEGYILDGFPRTIGQARALDNILADKGETIDYVINISLDEDTLIKRMGGRRICDSCGALYHIDDYPPKKDGECDKCGAALSQREDDKEDTIRRRLTVYKEQTLPIISYYKDKGIVVEVLVDKDNDVKELVTEVIFKAMGVS